MEKAARLRQVAEVPVVAETSEPVRKEVHLAPPVPAPGDRLTPANPFLVNLHDPHSPVAEEYRKLKSVLVKMTKGEHFRNALMVTSSVPNEGKSLTALNLAISLAQELDHTVLLIDADLRRPSLHRYLGIEKGVGLADVLLGEAEIGQTLIPTGIGKLSVMRAGRHVENPAELFSSQRMKELVQEMKLRYPDRYLIFDTPPVLPFAETRSLAHLVDGVLFVVMERLADQGSVRDAIDSLKGCQLLGLVYNAAALSGNDERYSYYRNYDNKKHVQA
jgi:receptor protein-tyrosine kinase/non-specific protein-tyrosine kinase